MDQGLQAAKRHRLGTTFLIPDLALSLAELWRRRDLLWHMTVRHLRSQYKQSVLGYAWALLNPLSMMLILSFVFSQILLIDRLGNIDVPYPLFLLVGLLPWIFFSSAIFSATDSVVGGASLVTKVYFPREILPTAAVFTKVVDLAFGLLILVGLMVYLGQAPTVTILWVPLIFLTHLLFTLGISFPLAALNLYFHDVRFLVGVTLTLLFYMTPIIYPIDIVPERYHLLFELNPNSLFINAYRRVVLMDIGVGVDRLLLGIAIAVLTFLVGYYLFKKMEPGFADKI
ncbi:MAG: ABC transporter permease [Dehalococcoidia bacterium]